MKERKKNHVTLIKTVDKGAEDQVRGVYGIQERKKGLKKGLKEGKKNHITLINTGDEREDNQLRRKNKQEINGREKRDKEETEKQVPWIEKGDMGEERTKENGTVGKREG